VLDHFHDQVDVAVRITDLYRVVDFRQLLGGKLDIHDRSDHLKNFADTHEPNLLK
jgi:hypothetical protein